MSRHTVYPPVTTTHRAHPVMRALRAAVLGAVILYSLAYAAVWFHETLGTLYADSKACKVRGAP